MGTLAAETGQYGTSLVLIKEDLEFEEETEATDEWVGMEEEEQGDVGAEELFAYERVFDGEEPEVPDRDPLSMDYDEFFEETLEEENNDENVGKGVEEITVEIEKDANPDVIDISEDSEVEILEEVDDESRLIITSVESLQATSVAGTIGKLKPASFRHLDVFRCSLCGKDYDTFDDFLNHRTNAKNHLHVPYDAENEKAFCCGICQRPWNQPRKALACAVFGHNPEKLYDSMFIHACPVCPENSLPFHSLAAVGRHWAVKHPDRIIPPFYATGKDQLPSIKITADEMSSTTEIMAKENPALILESISKFIYRPVRTSVGNEIGNSKMLKIYRCSYCKLNFETRREVELHKCLAVVALDITALQNFKPLRNKCEDCEKEFPSARNFRLHLLRSGCKKDGELKCMICNSLHLSYRSFFAHRIKGHPNIPFNAEAEFPYACKICQKPALCRRAAMICALFAHDPSSLKKAMFRYKCGFCSSFGFHSTLALKRHMEENHPDVEIPIPLKYGAMDRPLPSVYISLDQLLSLKHQQKFGLTLVSERELHPTTLNCEVKKALPASEKALEEATFFVNTDEMDEALKMIRPKPKPVAETVYLSTEPMNTMSSISSDIVRKQLIQESVEKNICVICNKWFKDIRRHFKVHDTSRFDGVPAHKCVCGKAYHLRNSLHSHWKSKKECKRKVMEMNITDQQQNTAPSDGYVLKIPSPTPSPSHDSDIKIEFPEIKAVPIEPAPEGEIDLYSAYAKFDAEVPSDDEKVDFTKFLDLEVEEVEEECDNNLNDKVDEPSASSNYILKDKLTLLLPYFCSTCCIGFTTNSLFEQHLAETHQQDMYPFKCRHCGQCFRQEGHRKQHEVVHNLQKFKEVPSFACDQCDQKFPLKHSLVQHRRVKHFGESSKEEKQPLKILPKLNFLTVVDETPAKQQPLKILPKLNFLTVVDETPAKQQPVKILPKLNYLAVVGETPAKQQPVKILPKLNFLTVVDETPAKKQKLDEPSTPITCIECNASFEANYLLKYHMIREHTGEKAFKCELCGSKFYNLIQLRKHAKEAHEKKDAKITPELKTKLYPKPENQMYLCDFCPRKFTKPSYLQQHKMIHTGEKPHACEHCEKRFRLKHSLNLHKLKHHAEDSVTSSLNTYKCCVCGRQDFVNITSLLAHRNSLHKNIPFDKEKEKPFGCGVCHKPYFLKGQAMVCAILGHDPTELRRAMFKIKCPECPEERFGYHNYSYMVNHWIKEHPEKPVPAKYVTYATNDSLPSVVINKEKAAEIRENGPALAYDFTLVIEFDLLTPEDVDVAAILELDSYESPPDSPIAEEDLMHSAVISYEDALNAVKALVIQNEPKHKEAQMPKLSPQTRGIKRKVEKIAKPEPQESLSSDRALGNKRIAGIVERIRTARARKAALKAAVDKI